MPHVYMLRCSDGSYYVGSTRNLDLRLQQHQLGVGSQYTRRRLPVELVWSAEYPNIGDAFFWEKRIQGWSRAKREALIRGEYEALPGLAKKDFSRRRADAGSPDRPAPIEDDTAPLPPLVE
ncbi:MULTISPECIES: GIY-YIG nuclease family protein [unclassified Nocardioides]|uniref:GIY-YIG nuclease family protein n=1 Tax=unclassified Nocardioides TaxID=2615069 RepID=UPI0009E9F946|nr:MULTISPECIES: GIY-YIG nuclease family protein [unclassified Nocardioides]